MGLGVHDGDGYLGLGNPIWLFVISSNERKAELNRHASSNTRRANNAVMGR
jgi:hypothetical protein